MEVNGESLREKRFLSVALSHKPLEARLVGNFCSHSYNLYGWFHLEFGSCLAISRIPSNTCAPVVCCKGIIAVFKRWIRPAVLELVWDLFETGKSRKWQRGRKRRIQLRSHAFHVTEMSFALPELSLWIPPWNSRDTEFWWKNTCSTSRAGFWPVILLDTNSFMSAK